VGIASAINNAVARVAGVMAVAVFGALMVAEFSIYLNHQLAGVAMSSQARMELRAKEPMLAALKVPEGVDWATTAVLESSKAAAFVFGFRIVMRISAALALASAGVAWLMIAGGAREKHKLRR
jgi:hypothetical protein